MSPGPPPISPARGVGVLPKVLLALGVVVLLPTLIEGAARLVLGDAFVPGFPVGHPKEACAEYDEDLGWVNKPGVRTWVEAPQFRYRLAINSQGLRDREHPYEKPAGTFRVLLLGDSLAWGWGVDDGLAFADLVEEQLGPDVEVVNLGVPGYSTDQQYWALREEGLKYAPDLVLLCFALNDVVGNGKSFNMGFHKPRFEIAGRGLVREFHPAKPPPPREEAPEHTLLEWLHAHSALLQAVRPVDAEVQLAEEGRAQRERSQQSEREEPTEQKLAAFESYQQEITVMCSDVARDDAVTFRILRLLAEECRARDLPLVAFSIAHHHDRYLYSPRVLRPEIDEGVPFRTVLSRRLEEAGRILGFHTFSVDREMLDATGAGRNLTCGDGHLNAEGNRLVTRRITEVLEPVISACRAGTYAPPAPLERAPPRSR